MNHTFFYTIKLYFPYVFLIVDFSLIMINLNLGLIYQKHQKFKTIQRFNTRFIKRSYFQN